MLQGSYLSVLEAKSRDDFQREIVKFAHEMGFNTISATTVFDHRLGHPEFITVDNTPDAYKEEFVNVSTWGRDPVMQHCKSHSRPIIWNQSTYVQSGSADLWEEQAKFGYCTGIAMALHLPDGRHFFLGVDRDEKLPTQSVELTRMVADLQLFAVHAQEAAAQVLLPSLIEQEGPRLTPRELESLRWTMEGKTAWEVGKILGIAERTAVLHVNNAMHKLKCVTKHQAVLKAIRMGLLR